MKTKLGFIALTFTVVTAMYAQEPVRKFCGTDEKRAEAIKAHPEILAYEQQAETFTEEFIKKQSLSKTTGF